MLMKIKKKYILILVIIIVLIWNVKAKIPESKNNVENYINNYLQNKYPTDNFKIINLKEFGNIMTDYGSFDGARLFEHRKIGAYYWEYIIYSEIYNKEFYLIYENDNGSKKITSSYLELDIIKAIENSFSEFFVDKNYEMRVHYYNSAYYAEINEESNLNYKSMDLKTFTEELIYKNLEKIKYINLENKKIILYIDKWNISFSDGNKIEISLNPTGYQISSDGIKYSNSYVYFNDYTRLYDINVPI